MADRLLLLTDVTGVLDKTKKLLEKIPSSSLSGLTADGTISGGMIPKLGDKQAFHSFLSEMMIRPLVLLY